MGSLFVYLFKSSNTVSASRLIFLNSDFKSQGKSLFLACPHTSAAGVQHHIRTHKLQGGIFFLSLNDSHPFHTFHLIHQNGSEGNTEILHAIRCWVWKRPLSITCCILSISLSDAVKSLVSCFFNRGRSPLKGGVHLPDFQDTDRNDLTRVTYTFFADLQRPDDFFCRMLVTSFGHGKKNIRKERSPSPVTQI